MAEPDNDTKEPSPTGRPGRNRPTTRRAKEPGPWWRSQPVQIVAGGVGGILIALPFIALLSVHRRQAAQERQFAELTSAIDTMNRRLTRLSSSPDKPSASPDSSLVVAQASPPSTLDSQTFDLRFTDTPTTDSPKGKFETRKTKSQTNTKSKMQKLPNSRHMPQGGAANDQ